MITRRTIRSKVMQAIFACQVADQKPELVFNQLLRETRDDLAEIEKQKDLTGDTQLLEVLFEETLARSEDFDKYVQSKAENWELERIARLDRVLMHMAICEMLNFPEIPVKVTINEYLELAKKFSTPKSSKFINGILDSLYADFKKEGKIVKRGRGLIDHSNHKNPKNSTTKKKK